MKLNTDNIWLKVAVVLSVLPVAAWPLLLTHTGGGSALVWLYPFATVAYGALALACSRERAVLAWVLVVMSLLTSLSIWLL